MLVLNLIFIFRRVTQWNLYLKYSIKILILLLDREI